MSRADAGTSIVMKHTNINTGGMKMPGMDQDDDRHESFSTETDVERQERTGLSSVRMTDDESKAVQKTPYRVSLDSMLAKITDEEYLRPNSIPHMTICVLLLENGYAIVGKSAPADAANYDAALGRKFAKEDCIRQMWPLEAYLLRDRMAAE